MIFKIYDSSQEISTIEKKQIVNFLAVHLDQYGDASTDIEKAIDFSLKKSNPDLETEPLGGMVLTGEEEGQIIGAVVMNKTGMSGYIPDNILVYIAVHKDFRGKGLGKELINKVISLTKGDIKLHVEPDNPARFLYQKIGFTEPYIEMRLKNSNS